MPICRIRCQFRKSQGCVPTHGVCVKSFWHWCQSHRGFCCIADDPKPHTLTDRTVLTPFLGSPVSHLYPKAQLKGTFHPSILSLSILLILFLYQSDTGMLFNLHNRPSGACGGPPLSKLWNSILPTNYSFAIQLPPWFLNGAGRGRGDFFFLNFYIMSAGESISMPDSFFWLGHRAKRGFWDSPRAWHAIPGPVGFSTGGSLK